MTILAVTPQSPRRVAIVYLAREDGDGERAGIFRGRRARGMDFGLLLEKHNHHVLIVEDDDPNDWPEILEDFERHARAWWLPGTVRWTVLRKCSRNVGRRRSHPA